MRICLMPVLALVAVLSETAPAQPVFFDDFDGDELLPHWSTPPDDHWEYEVSGGMLNVTGLFYPSDPEDDANYAIIGAGYGAQTDFRADVWMGWNSGDAPHGLALYVNGPLGHNVASFGYEDSWRGQVLFAAASNEAVFELAPPPGMYQFTIARVGAQFGFYFNGQPFASITDRFGTLAAGLSLEFVGPYAGQLGSLHVDRVRIVPSPGTLAFVIGITGCRASSRRRRM